MDLIYFKGNKKKVKCERRYENNQINYSIFKYDNDGDLISVIIYKMDDSIKEYTEYEY